jgi:uncharacterized iron-regulated protein
MTKREQMMACLLAEMKTQIRINQASADANLKEIKELKSQVETNLEMLTQRKAAKLDAYQEKLVAIPEEINGQNETTAFQEMMEAYPEKAVVKILLALGDQYGNQHLALGLHR